jgi:polyferredoxin
MPILYLSTLLLVGPAWCSTCATSGPQTTPVPALVPAARPLPPTPGSRVLLTLLLVIAAALSFRLLGVPGGIAALSAAAFGLAGVVVMLTLSRRQGMMVHCTAYCPIGLVGNLLGKLSPFCLRMDAGCDRFSRCGACARACRYGALAASDVSRGRPGLTCTLCGDCVGVCPRSVSTHMACLFNLSPENLPPPFLTMVISLHARVPRRGPNLGRRKTRGETF